MKSPSVESLIEKANVDVAVEWDRRDQLLKRFNGLSKATLNVYQKEMEDIPEFKEGVIKPTHSVTWINIEIFVSYLRWKEAGKYQTKKPDPKDFLKEA